MAEGGIRQKLKKEEKGERIEVGRKQWRKEEHRDERRGRKEGEQKEEMRCTGGEKSKIREGGAQEERRVGDDRGRDGASG